MKYGFSDVFRLVSINDLPGSTINFDAGGNISGDYFIFTGIERFEEMSQSDVVAGFAFYLDCIRLSKNSQSDSQLFLP